MGYRENEQLKAIQLKGYYYSEGSGVDNLGNYAELDIDSGLTIYYDDSKINEPIIVRSLNDYMDALSKMELNPNLYFRGQNNINYNLKPSIYRSKKYFENEDEMYNETILRAPSEFERSKNHLDYLVKMQHFELPTRIMDTSNNPLFALYFACLHTDPNDYEDTNKDAFGEVIVFDMSDRKREIKYSMSDAISIISALPTLSFTDKEELYKKAKEYSIKYMEAEETTKKHIISEFNEDTEGSSVMSRFIYEIKRFRPAFQPQIIPDDLLSCKIVRADRTNVRISSQEGCFLAFGLFHEESDFDKIEEMRFLEDKKKIVIAVMNKQKILNELSSFGINTPSLFPSLDNICKHVKGLYS